MEDSCDCPIECKSISYSFSIQSKELDPKEVCPDVRTDLKNFDRIDFIMKPFYMYKSPPDFVRTLMNFRSNASDTNEVQNANKKFVTNCKKNLKYRAEVIFRMATGSMSVTVLSSRLSFSDKMSAFGKE